MKNMIPWHYLSKVKDLSLIKITIYVILIVLIMVSCVQIYDRRSFHNYVIEEAKKEVDSIINDSAKCSIESNKIIKDSVCIKTGCKASITINNNSNSIPNRNLQENSVLDILSKSDGLLSSNGLTFCVTLIVGLLASLLLFRIEKMEDLVTQNKALVQKNEELESAINKAVDNLKKTIIYNNKLQKQLEIYYKFSNYLTRFEGIFIMSVQIENSTEPLSQARTEDEKLDISTNIGHLCTRLSLLCGDLISRLNNPETKLDYITTDEKAQFDMYLEDTKSALRRCLFIVNDYKISALCTIIQNIIYCVEEIKNIIDSIEVKSE